MKFLALLLLSLSALCVQAQQVTYSRVSYTYFSTDSTTPSFERSINQVVTVTVDTAKKRIVIPRVELVESSCTKRNIINNVFASSKDTSLVIQNWNDAIQMVYPYIRVLEPEIRVLDFVNGIQGFQVFNYDYLAITYPKEGKYIRVLEFRK